MVHNGAVWRIDAVLVRHTLALELLGPKGDFFLTHHKNNGPGWVPTGDLVVVTLLISNFRQGAAHQGFP
ncbi:MAG: hypothetical protein ACXV7G_10115 [Halobacteriota archaeon]